MTVQDLWVYVSSNGDGSVSASFFTSKEKADRYRSYEAEPFTEDEPFQVSSASLDLPHYDDPETPWNKMMARYEEEVVRANGRYQVAHAAASSNDLHRARVVVGCGGILTKNAFGPLTDGA